MAKALKQLTGKVTIGGPIDGTVPVSKIGKYVNGWTQRGTKPFAALFYPPGVSTHRGHWVVVEGMERRQVKITDPLGTEHTMTPGDFWNAWRWQNLVIFK